MRSITVAPMPSDFGGPNPLPNGKPNPEMPCLKCHGSTEKSTVMPPNPDLGPDVTEDVLEAIAEFYPYDMALGYRAGAIRGAWTVKIPVVEGRPVVEKEKD